jgi:hypothetical protein
MVTAWQTATSDPDPPAALAATRALKAHLVRWEGTLAGEAIQQGATWQQIRRAVGVTRQAAWEQLHQHLHQLGQRGRAQLRDLHPRQQDHRRDRRRDRRHNRWTDRPEPSDG